jgi:hypothetical protein
MNLFSRIAENPAFVAFNAHSGFAFICVAVATHHSVSYVVAATCVLVLAAVKEFYVDIHFEDSPPQTYADGALDFVGYAAGVALAWLVS